MKKQREIPTRLSLDPFFELILKLDKIKLFKLSYKMFSSLGYEDISYLADAQEGYIFARGTLPVCLVAHMDKVPWYKKCYKIHKTLSVNPRGKVFDVKLSSKQGIGGDDRCGVYAILRMLKLGYRPSVLFCMGEEVGCKGSRKFCVDHEPKFLDGINAFIQIDRRGRNDCVRYSDTNDELINAICKFDYKEAIGSCSDISVLMPHFGISGVNLSSGYYHEHHAHSEYVSLNDVNVLLKRLRCILDSDIFNKRYEYVAYKWSNYMGSFASSNAHSQLGHYRQTSLFKDMNLYEEENENLVPCDMCGELHDVSEMTEVDDVFVNQVCPSCARSFIDNGYIKCSSCGKLYRPLDKFGTQKDGKSFCSFCGAMNDGE